MAPHGGRGAATPVAPAAGERFGPKMVKKFFLSQIIKLIDRETFLLKKKRGQKGSHDATKNLK